MDRIVGWDLPDTHMEPDGYDMKEVADPTGRNIEFLIEKINELIDEVNELRNN